jgi:hypothetical protein
MNNAVFWDIKIQFVSQRKHSVSTTKPSRLMLLRFEVFTPVTTKNAVFWIIRVTLVRIDVSEEIIASIIRVETITEIRATTAVPSN